MTNPAEIYVDLRNRYLQKSAESLGLSSEFLSQKIYGVMLDMGLSNGVATLATLIDHESVKQAVGRVCQLAAMMTDQFHLITDFSLPPAGSINFFLKTKDGVLGATATEEALTKNSHSLSPLFWAANEVITALRLVSESAK